MTEEEHPDVHEETVAEEAESDLQAEGFGDEGAGPEEDEDVTSPENLEAAQAFRDDSFTKETESESE